MNSEQRCATCRWWDRERPFGDRCDCRLTEADDGKPTHPESLAVAADCCSYWGVLRTAPDFGCVQHEAREPVSA